MLNKLKHMQVKSLAKPGRHSDGGGLYLVVDPSGAKRWCFKYQRAGKAREMGLGGYPAISIEEARNRAHAFRQAIATGKDPLSLRQQATKIPTFKELADEQIEAMSPKWRNAKHQAQWTSTIAAYCGPILNLPVDAIETQHILKILKPIWSTKTETAARLRGRIEAVLDAARAKGVRTAENPARWRGHLAALLPPRKRLVRGHHKAVPYKELPQFMQGLRKHSGTTASALEFLILTAARTGEVLGAKWDEFDLEAKVWTVPASRMKAGKEHCVPLAPRALAIIKRQAEVRTPFNDHVFPSYAAFDGEEADDLSDAERARRAKPLSQMAMAMLMRRMERTETVHGFRSSFRDWAADCTNFHREVIEQALAHVIQNQSEAAYLRSNMMAKRGPLMKDWESYVLGTLPSSQEGSVSSN